MLLAMALFLEVVFAHCMNHLEHFIILIHGGNQIVSYIITFLYRYEVVITCRRCWQRVCELGVDTLSSLT